MSGVDAIVRRAAGRWPAEIQMEMATEWLAELAAMRRDRVSVWRQITFALSLFASPPVEEPGRPARVWREELPSIGSATAQLVVLVAVGWGATFAASELPAFANFLALEASGNYPSTYVIGQPTGLQWPVNVAAVTALAVACAGFGWLGAWWGRKMPMPWARHTRLAVLGPVVIATLALGVALVAIFALDGTSAHRHAGVWSAVAVWMVLAVIATTFAVRSRRGVAIVVGLLGNLVALDIAGIVLTVSTPNASAGTGPWWFPLSLLDGEHSGVTYGDPYTYDAMVKAVGSVARPMLVCAAFLLWYAFRASRARPLAPKLRPVSTPHVSSTTPIRHAVAAALMAVGLALWVYTSAFLTPAIERITSGDSDPGELHIWVQEQRELAIGVAVVALVAAIIRRGPIALPALVAYAGLFTTDCIVDAHGLSGRRAVVVMAVVGAVVLGAAWWLSRYLAVRPADPLISRRAGAAVAIAAALVTPALCFQFADAADFRRLPTGLVPGSVAAMALMWCAAVAVASASRATPLPARAACAYTMIPMVILIGVGAWHFAAGLPTAGATTLGVVAVAVVRGGTAVRPVRWLLFVVGGLVATVPYVLVSILLALSVGGSVMSAAGYGYPSDGVPFLPGALPVAIGVGLLLAWVAVPRPPAMVPPSSALTSVSAS